MGSGSRKIRFPSNEPVEKGWDSREVILALLLTTVLPAL